MFLPRRVGERRVNSRRLALVTPGKVRSLPVLVLLDERARVNLMNDFPSAAVFSPGVTRNRRAVPMPR